MTDGLAETIIRDSLNEFDDRIMQRKISKQVIKSLGSTDKMSSVEEVTPKHSEPKNATQQNSADEESPTVPQNKVWLVRKWHTHSWRRQKWKRSQRRAVTVREMT